MRKRLPPILWMLIIAYLGLVFMPVNSAGHARIEEIPKPGTPYKWSGVKVQYNYFHIDPSTSRTEWGWNGQSWWDVIVDRLHPSVFVYDIIGDWYNWRNGTKNVNKYNMLKSWSKKLAEYAQRDNVTFILIIGNARDENIGIQGLINDTSDILNYIFPYPVAWFGIDVEHTNPTPTEDVALSIETLNNTVSEKGSRLCFLYSVGKEWAKPFKNVYPVLAGTNAPAKQGVTRKPDSPYGLWEVTLLDDYTKGFGIKVGLYHPGMENDWNDTVVVSAFNWADQTNNIGILAPNLDVSLLNKDEFTNAWVREASNRGYMLNGDIPLPQPELPHALALNIYSSPINKVSFTINGTSYITPLSTTLNEGTYTIMMPESTTVNGTTYNFKDWEDNSMNPTRIINLSGNMSITAYYEQAKGPPTTHVLSISSSPITEIPFTTNGTEHTTPWSNTLTEATYTISMPTNVTAGNTTYNFVRWEDQTTSPTRTINLTTDTTITAYYEATVNRARITVESVMEFESVLIATSLGAIAYLAVQRKFESKKQNIK